MNWSVYNDSLVLMGEILLDFSALEGWELWYEGQTIHLSRLVNQASSSD